MIRSFDHTTEYRGSLFVQNLGDVPYSVGQDIKLYTTVTRATVFTHINIHTVELTTDGHFEIKYKSNLFFSRAPPATNALDGTSNRYQYVELLGPHLQIF